MIYYSSDLSLKEFDVLIKVSCVVPIIIMYAYHYKENSLGDLDFLQPFTKYLNQVAACSVLPYMFTNFTL